MTDEWQPSEFEVAIGDHKPRRESIFGQTRGPFGISMVDGRMARDHTERWGQWRVTHLPTGRSLCPGNLDLPTETAAKQYAEALLPLTDWTAATYQSEAVQAIEHQAIALFDQIRAAAGA